MASPSWAGFTEWVDNKTTTHFGFSSEIKLVSMATIEIYYTWKVKYSSEPRSQTLHHVTLSVSIRPNTTLSSFMRNVPIIISCFSLYHVLNDQDTSDDVDGS